MTYHTDYMTAGDPDCPHAEWVTHATHEVSSCVKCGAVKEVIMTARVDVLARALIAVEWSGGVPVDQWAAGIAPCCPTCFAEPKIDRRTGDRSGSHDVDCALDAALRKAGMR